MVFALPLVHTRKRTLLNPFPILSFGLAIGAVCMFAAGENHWPKILDDIPEYAIYFAMLLIVLNGIYAAIQPTFIKPEATGCLEINDESQTVIISQYGRIQKIAFHAIDQIELESKNGNFLTGHFCDYFISITYNFNRSVFRSEFIVESDDQLRSIRKTFARLMETGSGLNFRFNL